MRVAAAAGIYGRPGRSLSLPTVVHCTKFSFSKSSQTVWTYTGSKFATPVIGAVPPWVMDAQSLIAWSSTLKIWSKCLQKFLSHLTGALWYCWLGDSKGILPVKMCYCVGDGGDVTGALHVIDFPVITTSISIISCCSKIQDGLTFLGTGLSRLSWNAGHWNASVRGLGRDLEDCVIPLSRQRQSSPYSTKRG